MKKAYLLQFLLLLIFIISSCSSNERSHNNVKETLEIDSRVLTDSLRRVITRLDSTSIAETDLVQWISALMDSANVTGLALSIMNDNQVVFRKAFGYADFENKVPLQINHSFSAASFSKAVFGYLVSILINEGVMALDEPLQKYLDFPLYQLKSDTKWSGFKDLQNDKRYERITARMCLTHSTGFQNWRWIQRPGEDENSKKLKIYFDPGTQYFYSGEGIMLLQYVIEHITGKNIEELAREKVFNPLNMKNTSYVWQERFEDRFSYGHNVDQNKLEKSKRFEGQAAGSLETNLIDYSLFLKHIILLYHSNSSITKLMLTPSFRIRTKAQFGPLSLVQSDENDDIELSYGLGWGILKSPYGLGAFKEGHDDGFQHFSIIFPQTGIGIVILSNSDNAESIFKELLEISIGDKYTPWKWENYIPYNMKD